MKKIFFALSMLTLLYTSCDPSSDSGSTGFMENVTAESVDVIAHNAEIAQLVEHNLAKVGVASSSLVFRSRSLEWWNGRHEGLKILWAEMSVRVRVSLRAHPHTLNVIKHSAFFLYI